MHCVPPNLLPVLHPQSFLGEALRGLLVAEMRTLTVRRGREMTWRGQVAGDEGEGRGQTGDFCGEIAWCPDRGVIICCMTHQSAWQPDDAEVGERLQSAGWPSRSQRQGLTGLAWT